MKALIKVGYGCNENCTFCHTLDVRHIDGASAEVQAKIERAKRLGHTMVVLSGGEPTTRPELLDWASQVARLGMDFGLVTNGLMLAYPELVEKLLERRLRYVYMSLHGGTPRVHNSLVRADTFGDAMRALKNLSGRGLDLTVNCVVAKQNLAHLRELVDALAPFPDATLKFSMVQPKGGGEAHFQSLVPRVSEVAAAVVDAIAYGGGGPRFRHDGIPLCLLPGLEDRYADLKTDQFATMVEIGEPDFFPVDDKAKIQPGPCRDCRLRGPCPGLYSAYHQQFGDSELRPRNDGPRSNSFNWIFEAMVRESGDGCPLLEDGTSPWDRGRHLFAKNGGRVARFRAVSRDFSDVEIEHIKHDLGQVYLDLSKKDAPDDFPRDLVPLRRSHLCDPCDKKPQCTGLWEPIPDPRSGLVEEDWFTRDDRRVKEILAALRGRVLDLGCGDGPYDEILAPLAESGAIRYVGIDPDPARIERLRARRPWAELRVGDGESLVDLDFDHVLILRSWNHLHDPALVLARLSGLPSGATLTIVDNQAFGLVRTRTQAARGESSGAALEHFHNHGADDVLRLKPPQFTIAFELLETRAVSPLTSNQWLVRFRRL
jgi:pyruvate-formate lyase-activating enzyme/2-polyprenyl-3-methyl-5-hydroxy-6-metoxy-1,4-benzoquinol methylase